jgi:hypothetical protein
MCTHSYIYSYTHSRSCSRSISLSLSYIPTHTLSALVRLTFLLFLLLLLLLLLLPGNHGVVECNECVCEGISGIIQRCVCMCRQKTVYLCPYVFPSAGTLQQIASQLACIATLLGDDADVAAVKQGHVVQDLQVHFGGGVYVFIVCEPWIVYIYICVCVCVCVVCSFFFLSHYIYRTSHSISLIHTQALTETLARFTTALQQTSLELHETSASLGRLHVCVCVCV